MVDIVELDTEWAPANEAGNGSSLSSLSSSSLALDSQRADSALNKRVKCLVQVSSHCSLSSVACTNMLANRLPLLLPVLARPSRSISQSNPPINQLVWLVNEQPLARIMAPEEANPTKKSTRKPKKLAGQSGTSASPDTTLPDEEAAALLSSITTATTKQTSSTEDELLNWSFNPLTSNAIDASKYRFQASSLVVMNLTKFDSQDEYKCLAINRLGQQASPPLRLGFNCK